MKFRKIALTTAITAGALAFAADVASAQVVVQDQGIAGQRADPPDRQGRGERQERPQGPVRGGVGHLR